MRRAGALIALLFLAAPAHAATTSCAFAGPTGTFRATTFDLPEGSSTLSLTLNAANPSPTASSPAVPGTSHASWHVAGGIFVIDRDTLQVVAARVSNDGLAPRRALVSMPGSDPVVVDTPGPGVPIHHSAQPSAPGLLPGHYAVVAFGSDGDAAAPNPWWTATFQVDGDHSCLSSGAGTVFDRDATAFSGGTAVGAASVLYADGMTLAWTSARQLVVGLVDANGGPGGTASVGYKLPSHSATVTNAIAPFATRGGALSWTASATGAATALDIAGVEVDLP